MFTVSLLSTIAECDAVLTMTTRELDELNWKQSTLARQQTHYSQNSVEAAAELQAVQDEMALLDSKIPTMPDGKEKRDAVARKKYLEYRITVLENRKYSNGAMALIDREVDLAKVRSDITIMNDLAAEVAARKSTL